MSIEPLPHLGAATRRDIADTVPVPRMMPSAPFSRALALWLCRACSYWNAPHRGACIDCGRERPE